MKRSIDEPSGYLERLRPIYVRLFRVAHAIVGNLELSEYVLKSAIVEAYLRRKEWQGRMGFSEGLLHTVRGVALAELKGMRAAGAFEADWTLPIPDAEPGSGTHTLLTRLQRESETTQRVAMLFYGCGLTPRQIAFVMQSRTGDAGGRLRRLTSRLSRSVRTPTRGARALEDQLEVLMNAALMVRGEDVAEMGAVFRSFERDVDGARRSPASAGRVFGMVLKGVVAVALAAVIWLIAVLLEPSTSSPQVAATGAPIRSESTTNP